VVVGCDSIIFIFGGVVGLLKNADVGSVHTGVIGSDSTVFILGGVVGLLKNADLRSVHTVLILTSRGSWLMSVGVIKGLLELLDVWVLVGRSAVDGWPIVV
jgi:hypothetical protein